MLLRPPQLEASTAVVLAGPHKVSRNWCYFFLRDPADPRDEKDALEVGWGEGPLRGTRNIVGQS
jgi:hypothetical protein